MCIVTGGALAAGIASVIISGVGTAVSGIYSQNQKIKMQNASIKQNIANAQMMQNLATEERQAGINEARRAKLKSILQSGDLMTKTAASNIGLNSQTALNLAETENMAGEENALSLINEANKKADSYISRAQSYYDNAQLTSFSAKGDKNSFLFDSGMKITSRSLDTFSDNVFKRNGKEDLL